VYHAVHKAFADHVGLPPTAEGLWVQAGPCDRYIGPQLALGLAA
jgi:hypothetical protein